MAAVKTQSKSYTTPLLVGLLIVAVFVIGMMWQRLQMTDSNTANNNPSAPSAAGQGQNPPPPPARGEVTPVSESDHVRGNPNAKIAWIEYSDYECPFCGRIHPDLVQLLEEYPDDILWVYRHFPLESIHPNARTLSYGAECAAELAGEEAFWAYTDAAYEQQASSPDPVELGVEVGVSRAAMQECIDSGRYEDRVNADLVTGQEAGVTGTPGNVVLNTETGEFQLIPGALPYAQLEAVVQQLLES